MSTAGLGALDQEREASMADEGGMSGAVMESEGGDTLHAPTEHRPLSEPFRTSPPSGRWLRRAPALLAGAVALGLLAGVALRAAPLRALRAWRR